MGSRHARITMAVTTVNGGFCLDVKTCPHDGFSQRNGTARGFNAATTIARNIDVETWRVIDEWPELAPVSQREIEVIDTFLHELVDELLGVPRAHK
jgi:hypothetical protein